MRQEDSTLGKATPAAGAAQKEGDKTHPVSPDAEDLTYDTVDVERPEDWLHPWTLFFLCFRQGLFGTKQRQRSSSHGNKRAGERKQGRRQRQLGRSKFKGSEADGWGWGVSK